MERGETNAAGAKEDWIHDVLFLSVAVGAEFALRPLADFVEIEADFPRTEFHVRQTLRHVAVNGTAATLEQRGNVALVTEWRGGGGRDCAELLNRRRFGLR